MGLTARDKDSGDFEPIPEDLHLGVCYGIWDLGTQYSEVWHKFSHRVVIVWELPEIRGEFERDGKKVNLPKVISKQYRLSLHKKAGLRKDMESWRGKKFTEEELAEGFDLKKLLGVPCQIQVLHFKSDEGKIYANISAIIKSSAGRIIPENPITFFSFEDGLDIPKSTPEWIEKIIKQAKEYGQERPILNDETAQNQEEDPVPF